MKLINVKLGKSTRRTVVLLGCRWGGEGDRIEKTCSTKFERRASYRTSRRRNGKKERTVVKGDESAS